MPPTHRARSSTVECSPPIAEYAPGATIGSATWVASVLTR